MAKTLSVHDLITTTAKQKHAAAKARSSPSAADKPKEVIFAACQIIANDLKGDGFSFIKKGPALKRVQGDLTSTIGFQSDRNNIAGERAAVWIHAYVTSEKLGKANGCHPIPWGDEKRPGANIVTAGQIGNLLAEPTWMEWDFANEETRQSEIEDAIEAIRRIILPFFDLFDDPPSAVQLLVQRPGLLPSSLVRYARLALGHEVTERAGNTFLMCYPLIRERFDEALAQFKRNGLPAYCADIGSDLAAIAIANDLDFYRHS